LIFKAFLVLEIYSGFCELDESQEKELINLKGISISVRKRKKIQELLPRKANLL